MCNNQNQLNFLQGMEDHMFSSKNLILFTKYKINSNFVNKMDKNQTQNRKGKENRVNENKRKVEREMFETVEKDSLFWCFYVLLNGIDMYDQIGNQHFVEEKKLKFKFIEEIRLKKDILKMHKIKPLSELEDDLANQERIGEKTFQALCILFHVNAFIVYKNQYYEMIYNDDPTISILYKTEKPLRYKLDLKTTTDKLDKYKEHYFKLPKLNFKMKAVSSYKLDELKEMAQKLGLNNDTNKKKQTKTDLYESIIQLFR